MGDEQQGTYERKRDMIQIEHWEADDYVINVKGVGLVGSTLNRRDAETAARWLAGTDLIERPKQENAK